MNKDIIRLAKNDEEKDYQLLMTIDDKYIIYTELDNTNIKKDIHVLKVNSIENNNESISISDEELEIVTKKYLNIIK